MDFHNEIPLERAKEPRSRYEALESHDEQLNARDPISGLRKSTTLIQRTITGGGGKTVIFTTLTLIMVPMLGLAALLLGLVLANNVEKPANDAPTSTSLTLDLRAEFDSSAFYVDFNPTTLVTIASWSSTVAPLLAVCAMMLVAFPLAQSLRDNSQTSGSNLPTPFQFSMLLDSLSAGITPLWSVMSYWCWPHKDGKMPSNVRNALSVLAVFTILGYTIAGVDTWLHLVMEAVNIELADAQIPQEALGRGLPSGLCSTQSEADFDAGDCITTTTGSAVFLIGANEAAKVMSNTSSTNAVYDMYIGDRHFAYLGPAHIPTNLDYRTEALGVHTQCSQMGKQCGLGINKSETAEPFHCTDSFYGDLSQPIINGGDKDGVTKLAFRSAGIVFFKDAALTQLANLSSGDGADNFSTRPTNPHYLAAWAKTELGATDNQTADGNVVTPTHGGTSWLLNCSTTAYQITYDFINGTLQHVTAERANGSVGTLFNIGAYYGFGKVALETAAYSANQYQDPPEMADAWARAYSRTAAALGSGIIAPRANLEEQIRSTKLVSRVPKAPLYTLVGLNTLYALLGVALACLALSSHPSETNELRKKLSTAGIVAACFEGERAERAVEKKREMFAEYEGADADAASGRVSVEESKGLGAGGFVFRLRKRGRKSVL
jgi:hypothetical protein